MRQGEAGDLPSPCVAHQIFCFPSVALTDKPTSQQDFTETARAPAASQRVGLARMRARRLSCALWPLVGSLATCSRTWGRF